MIMKNRFLLLLSGILSLSACGIIMKAPVPVSKTRPQNNSTYKVEYLFEYDGCKVYRFWDGHDVYFTNCNGQAISYPDSTRVIENTTHRKN